RAADHQMLRADEARLKAMTQMQNRQQDAEMARMRDVIKRQEQQIRDLERRNKEIQDKQKGKGEGQALLQYRIAAADARLGQLKALYTENHPALRQARYERDFLAQLERTERAHRDQSLRQDAIREEQTRKLLDLDQEIAKLE